jgi:hypothetical protein
MTTTLISLTLHPSPSGPLTLCASCRDAIRREQARGIVPGSLVAGVRVEETEAGETAGFCEWCGKGGTP